MDGMSNTSGALNSLQNDERLTHRGNNLEQQVVAAVQTCARAKKTPSSDRIAIRRNPIDWHTGKPPTIGQKPINNQSITLQVIATKNLITVSASFVVALIRH